jgi:putative hydrolase of the HAD superfamily
VANKTKVIVFDLGNVLIPFDYNRIIDAMNSIEDGLGNRFVKRYYDNYDVHQKYERWILNDSEFISILTEWSENKIPEERLKNIYADLFEESKETSALLPLLKKNYQLVLLSNTNFIHQKYGWEKYEFLKFFDKLILSHEVGAIKPEAKIYRAVEAFTNETPESHIFIDDIAEYIEGAKKLGWNGVQFTSAKKLKIDLESLGIKLG